MRKLLFVGILLFLFTVKAYADSGLVLVSTFSVHINYGFSAQVLLNEGHYDNKHPLATSQNFSSSNKQGEGQIIIQLFQIKQFMDPQKIIQELDSVGSRPLDFKELLVFGAQYPDAQKSYEIIALGSVWSHLGWDYYPCLGFEDGIGRSLGVESVLAHPDKFEPDRFANRGWLGDAFSFAAVQK